MITKTLRIKKVYFEEIKKGVKLSETRAKKPYYDWLASIETPFRLKLHYQKKDVYLFKTVTRVTCGRRTFTTPEVPTLAFWELHFI